MNQKQYNNTKFPSTLWTELLDKNELNNKESFFVNKYWNPIFFYIKHWKTKDDPEDVTQDFFVKCLEEKFLEKMEYRPRKGSFRAYLKKNLYYYLVTRYRKDNSIKNGVNFDPKHYYEEQNLFYSPDDVFEYIWAKELMEDTYKKLNIVMEDLEFLIFKKFFLGKKTSYKEIQKEFEVDFDKVKKSLNVGKNFLQKIVQENLLESGCTKQELEEELVKIKHILLNKKMEGLHEYYINNKSFDRNISSCKTKI